MKEFVEKLIGRLGEIYDRNDKAKKEAYEEQDWERFDLFTHRNDGIYSAISIVNQLAEEYNNGWIPCERELPKENEFVISSIHPSKSVNGGNPVIISVYNSVSASYWNDGTIQAWMPLPEPYQKGE